MAETDRDIVLGLMPAALEAKLMDVETALDAMRTNTIMGYYNLGKILKAVHDSPDRYRGTDGTDGIALLLRATGKHDSTLREALRFVDQYTREDLDALLALENKKTGFKIIWSHVHILLTLSTKSERKRYASKVVREELTAKELHDSIKQDQDRESSHGRPFVVPATISKQLTAMQRDLVSLLKKQEQVWNGEGHSTFNTIMATAEDELDTDWLTQMEEIREKFTLVCAQFATNISDMDGCIGRIRGILDDRAAEATREANERAEAVVASSGRPRRAVQLDDAGEEPAPEPVVRRSRGRRTAVEV